MTTKAIYQHVEQEGQGLNNRRPNQDPREHHQDCDDRISRQQVH